MLESVITFLIYICVVAIVIYLVIWVLRDVVGLPLPAKVIQILWVIFALIVILFLVRLVLPMAGGHGRLLGEIGIISSAHAEPFYPACLNKDDWVHGLTRKECVQKPPKGLGGHWYTAKVLKRARRVM
jgi:hypothetical protein